MSVLLNLVDRAVVRDVLFHRAWRGQIAGLTAEKMLRGSNKAFQYILRQGEPAVNSDELHFYLTFVAQDLSVQHRPFTITLAPEGWYYENGGGGGPYVDASIDQVLHLIMHCDKEQCMPLV